MSTRRYNVTIDQCKHHPQRSVASPRIYLPTDTHIYTHVYMYMCVYILQQQDQVLRSKSSDQCLTYYMYKCVPIQIAF